MPTSADKYGPWINGLETYERMHIIRVEGTNGEANSSKGFSPIAVAEDDAPLNIKGNYSMVEEYFTANGATIIKDLHNFNETEQVKNQLREELQYPPWSDGLCPASAQFNRCVYIAGHGGRSMSGADRCAGRAASVQVGKDAGALRLDDVLSPLADAPERWKSDPTTPWASRNGWTGLLTIIIDSCHSGAWIKDMIAKIKGRDPILQKIWMNFLMQFGTVHISFRVSSSSEEVTWYDANGGHYTRRFIDQMEKQPDRGDGYGTRAFVQNKVGGDDVVWTPTQCSCAKQLFKGHAYCATHPQTDVAADFRLGLHGWRWWFPESRQGYITWE